MAWQDFIKNNSNTLLEAGIGLVGGRTAAEQASGGLLGFRNGARANKTMKFLQESNPELAQMVQSGAIEAGDAYKLHYQQQMEASKPKNPWQAVGGSLHNFETGEWRSPPAAAGSNEQKFFGSPIYGKDKDGNPVIMQLSNQNQLVPAQTPEGVIPLSPFDKSYQTSQGAAQGKTQAETIASLDSINAKMPGLQQNVKELYDLADKATYTTTGQFINWAAKESGYGATDGAKARTEYIAKIDNQILPLLRDTFGAAFTVAEGDRLRDTLGDPNSTPEEKKLVLNAFIEQKMRDAQALAIQAGASQGGVPAQAQQPSAGAGKTSSGVSFKVLP